MPDEIKTLTFATQKAWRNWLAQNHQTEQAIWLIFYKAGAGKKAITYSEAVDEALCFGWIDSKVQKVDEQSRRQYFSKRKPRSVWSKINKAKIERLVADGLMTPAGMSCIELAKQNGSWNSLDDIDEMIVPTDLQKPLSKSKTALEFFSSLSPSNKKLLLEWLATAKRPETRQKRIDEIVANAKQKKKPPQFQ